MEISMLLIIIVCNNNNGKLQTATGHLFQLLSLAWLLGTTFLPTEHICQFVTQEKYKRFISSSETIFYNVFLYSDVFVSAELSWHELRAD